ncbi:DUF4345 domain-containing protein [Flammeovirga pacifica]|nr:DUF4345 domain-containing protein [Flammeovirga pacifica]
MNSKIISIYLFLASTIGLYVGFMLVFFPAEIQSQSDIIIGNNISHFNETRAPGAAILLASLIILIGMIKQSLRTFSIQIATLFYSAYGLGRLLSVLIDGFPADGLFYAMIGELLLGGIGGLILLQQGKSKDLSSDHSALFPH